MPRSVRRPLRDGGGGAFDDGFDGCDAALARMLRTVCFAAYLAARLHFIHTHTHTDIHTHTSLLTVLWSVFQKQMQTEFWAASCQELSSSSPSSIAFGFVLGLRIDYVVGVFFSVPHVAKCPFCCALHCAQSLREAFKLISNLTNQIHLQFRIPLIVCLQFFFAQSIPTRFSLCY